MLSLYHTLGDCIEPSCYLDKNSASTSTSHWHNQCSLNVASCSLYTHHVNYLILFSGPRKMCSLAFQPYKAKRKTWKNSCAILQNISYKRNYSLTGYKVCRFLFCNKVVPPTHLRIQGSLSTVSVILGKPQLENIKWNIPEINNS